MTPELLAVVAAAERVVDDPRNPELATVLDEAVSALRARRLTPAGTGGGDEQERTWAEVVAGDEIRNLKTSQWHSVLSTVSDPKTGDIKVRIKGVSQRLTRKPGDSVRVRRGVLGDAADLFEVLWSDTGKEE